MKKALLILTLCSIQTNVFATEMCANDDTIVIPVSNFGGIQSGKYGQWGNGAMWITTFTSGHKIYGEYTILSTAEGGEPSSNAHTTANGIHLPTDGSISNRIGTDADGNKREWCWCRITHPFSTMWYHPTNFPGCGNTQNTTSCCASGCAISPERYIKFVEM